MNEARIAVAPTLQAARSKGGYRRPMSLVGGRLSWIVVDPQTGQPLPHAAYVIWLADGSARRGRLDAESRLVEEAIPEGPARIDIRRPSRASRTKRWPTTEVLPQAAAGE